MPEFILDDAGEVNGLEFAELCPITRGYIEAMFFTNQSCIPMVEFWTPESQELITEGQADGDLPNDAGFSDLHPDALNSIHSDCRAFNAKARALLSVAGVRGYDLEQAGRDFWYTRNGHGVGFWDRSELDAEGLGDKLSEVARTFREVNPYFYQDEASPTGYGFVQLD